jgi:hypothetical protein
MLQIGCRNDSVQAPVPDGQASELSYASDPDVFWAEPAIIQVCTGMAGRTTLHWKVPLSGRFEIRVGAPEGGLFALVNPEGSKETDDWVTDKMTFYLVKEGTTDAVASISVGVTREGCQ